MRSRLVYYLAASVLVHLAVLGLPFAVTTGSRANQGVIPVRVHLLSHGETVAGATSKQHAASAQRATAAPVERQPADSSTRSTAGPSATTQSRTAIPSARVEDKKPNEPRPFQPQTVPVEPRRTNQPATLALQDETAADPKVSPARPTKSKPMPLRTTTVYPGPASRASLAKSAVESHVAPKAGDAGTQPATAPTSQGRFQASQPATSSHARYARVVKPEYPEHARAQGWEGTTVLKVLVDRAGKSEHVRVQQTSGFNVLDDAAVNAITRWEFYPARQGHKTVQSWVSVPIIFKLKEEN